MLIKRGDCTGSTLSPTRSSGYRREARYLAYYNIGVVYTAWCLGGVGVMGVDSVVALMVWCTAGMAIWWVEIFLFRMGEPSECPHI